VQAELVKYKKANPKADHKEAFSAVAAQWSAKGKKK
jgi:hypothetical protein